MSMAVVKKGCSVQVWDGHNVCLSDVSPSHRQELQGGLQDGDEGAVRLCGSPLVTLRLLFRYT